MLLRRQPTAAPGEGGCLVDVLRGPCSLQPPRLVRERLAPTEFAIAVAAVIAAGCVTPVGFGADSLVEALAGFLIVRRTWRQLSRLPGTSFARAADKESTLAVLNRTGVASADLLRGARVYLSGPMDFVASRKDESEHGWRRRVGDVLESYGVTVFNPWHKPAVRGIGEYGREGEKSDSYRDRWNFEGSAKGARARADCARRFWPTMHIDLRMVDTSDFVIAFCPTNTYSVGTPHEIVVARQQKKPVLFVSPPVEFSALPKLRRHLRGDTDGIKLLKELEADVPIKPNPDGVPSLWYMALIDSESFFDGFGFREYKKSYGWEPSHFDDLERRRRPQRPLLPFLEDLAHGDFPQEWDRQIDKWKRNEDWMLWETTPARDGAEVTTVHTAPRRTTQRKAPRPRRSG